MGEPKPSKTRRLTPALWAVLGVIVGLAFGGFGTVVQSSHNVNSGRSSVKTLFYGVTVHERDPGPEAMDKEVQMFGIGLPILFALAGGATAFVAVVAINRRRADQH